MCLAVPMELVALHEGHKATAELDGNRYDVDVSLVPDAAVGDYLIVHAGFAIEKLDKQEADARLALFGELAAAAEESL